MLPEKFKADMSNMRGTMLENNNREVQEFLSYANALLKRKGWKYEGQKLRSAMYERRYTNGTRTVTITGWHGTGRPGTNRFYGASKSFLDLYLREGHKKQAHIEADLLNHYTLEQIIAAQMSAMAAALEFIETL